MTTKIPALTDALGNLLRFELLPRQRFDAIGVPPLIDGLPFEALTPDFSDFGGVYTIKTAQAPL